VYIRSVRGLRVVARRVSALALASGLAACQLLLPTVEGEPVTAPDAGALDTGGKLDAALSDSTIPDARTPDSTVSDSATSDSTVTDGGPPNDATAGPDADACAHVTVPPPPTQDSPGTQSITFVAALRTVTGIEPGQSVGPGIGFDLDGVCTCPAPPSCRSPVMPANPNCDMTGGRDLQGDPLIEVFEESFASSGGDITNRIEQGRLTLLAVVSDYNGGPDDTQVTVSVYDSSGLHDPDGGAVVPPAWNGNDEWNVDPTSSVVSSLTDAGWQYTPVYFTTTAYVTGNTLVASLDAIPFQLDFATILFRSFVASATIAVDANGRYGLAGTFGARIDTNDIFTLLGRLQDGDAGFLCGTDPAFLQLRGIVCQASDIMSSPSEDNTNAVCDSVSLGVGFTASPAALGGPVPGQMSPYGCDGAVYTCTP